METEIIRLLAGIYVIWNLFACGVVGFDKFRATRGRWRVRERTLMLLVFGFGGIGVYAGMQLFRHKTRHPKFTWGVPFGILVNLAVLWGIWRLSHL